MDTRLKVRKINSNLDNIKKSVSDGKSSVASAITAKGVTTAADATYAVMAANIRAISTKPRITNLGSGYSFNVSGICPNYRELTADNFVVDVTLGGNTAGYESTNNANYSWRARTTGLKINKSYNASTGVFTISNYSFFMSCDQLVNGNVSSEHANRWNATCNTKVIY